jgi:hypothetical protein
LFSIFSSQQIKHAKDNLGVKNVLAPAKIHQNGPKCVAGHKNTNVALIRKVWELKSLEIPHVLPAKKITSLTFRISGTLIVINS